MSCIMAEQSYGRQLLVCNNELPLEAILTCASVAVIAPRRRGRGRVDVSNQVLRHERVYVSTEVA
jgi:hypothetical protein